MTMRKRFGLLLIPVGLACLLAAVWAVASEIDDQLMASRRVFPKVGPGLRALRRTANGNYYVLSAPDGGVAVFDSKEKQLAVLGAAQETAQAAKDPRPLIGFGEDCDVDAKGNIYIADRGSNQIVVLSPEGKMVRSFPVNSPTSIAALSDGEIAVTKLQQSHLVTIFGSDGKVVREFGDPESVSARADLDRYINQGRVASDPQGYIYYGFTYMPEPLVRQYDRFGFGHQSFEFTGVDAFAEAQSTRKEIERQETRTTPPSLHPILTAFGVDPISGDVWMGLHNTLVHFDKEGNRRSEYQVYTKNGARLEASIILVQEETLLIGADPLGVYEFQRPDKRH